VIEELIFTSSPRGLHIGKSGFCTVASTPQMTPNLSRLLESLSGYRHLFNSGSPETQRNPVVYSLLRVKVGGHQRYVMSRIADAGVDYSGRSNKLAHHVCLPPAFGVDGKFDCGDGSVIDSGPTRLLLDKLFFFRQWQGESRWLPPRLLLKNAAVIKPCRTWEKVTGDAGWAGDFVAACQSEKVIYLIVTPATPAIALLHEAISLMPQDQQWRTTFSTFFRPLPPNVECQIRCVMSNSPEIQMARQSQNAIVWDLTKLRSAPSGELIQNARLGQPILKFDTDPSSSWGVGPKEDARGARNAAIKVPSSDFKPESARFSQERSAVAPDVSQTDMRTKQRWWMSIVVVLTALIVSAFSLLLAPSLRTQVASMVSWSSVLSDRPIPDAIEQELEVEFSVSTELAETEPIKVFERLVPPPVLSPPIVSVDAVPKTEPAIKLKTLGLAPGDVSFSPHWQAIQKSRFPQPILFARRLGKSSRSLRFSVIDRQGQLKLKPESAGRGRLFAGDRDVGVMQWVEHKEGEQLEFQWHLDAAGVPQAFWDDLDLLNACILEVASDTLPPTRFTVSTQFIRGHLDLDHAQKYESVEFGIGGEQRIDILHSRGVKLKFSPNTPPKPAADLTGGMVRALAQNMENELAIEMSVLIPPKREREFSPQSLEVIQEMDITLTLMFKKNVDRSLRYRWGPLAFRRNGLRVIAEAWNFRQHPITIINRELKKRMRQKQKDHQSGLQASGRDSNSDVADLEAWISRLGAIPGAASESLQLSELIPGRLLKPIEIVTDDGGHSLLFIDIGPQGQVWEDPEMREAWRGEIVR
jgi:hypothetical protein